MDLLSSDLVPVDESSAARAIGRFLSRAGASNLPPDAAASLSTLQATLEGRGSRSSAKSKKRRTVDSSSSRAASGSAANGADSSH
jgi:hypothetical protein